MRLADLTAVKTFTDRAIGLNYYSDVELNDIFERSQKNGIVCSFVLVDPDNTIFGIRISFPPGKWSKGKGTGLNTQLWKTSLEDSGYFQSLFLDPEVQAHGWGGKLSEAAIEALKAVGCKAIVCHAWRESPHDSSRRYLKKLGFELVASHPLYWNKVDYVCTRCGKPCVCTADEMIKYLYQKRIE
jgi:GNAT superfamily N-acetyltransferase